MRYSIILLALSACVSAVASAQTYGLDNTDPAVFSKFRIPKTALSALWFNTGLNYSSTKNSIFGEGEPNSNSLNSNFNASFSPQYLLLEESDNRYLSLNASATGSSQIQYQNWEGPNYQLSGNVRHDIDAVTIGVSATYRDYLPSGDMFYSAGTNDQFSTMDQYGSASANLVTVGYTGQKQQSYNVSVGIGFGKMRNVTSVVSAVRFQQRLKQLNLLNGDLSEKTIEDLAQEFYREGYYGGVHVRPEKFFWQDVQSTLEKDGVSLAGLNQYADSYIREIPSELRFIRNEGIVAGLDLQLQYNNSFHTIQFGPYFMTEGLYTMANVYVQYSHQLNLDSQLSFSASLSGGPNLVKDSPVTQQYVTGAEIGYDYGLTDRIVASVSNSLNVIFQNMGLQSKNLVNNLDASLNYFVEDNVSLSASYSLDYDDVKNPQVSPIHTTAIDNYIIIGVTYYINRGFLYK